MYDSLCQTEPQVGELIDFGVKFLRGNVRPIATDDPFMTVVSPIVNDFWKCVTCLGSISVTLKLTPRPLL